MLSVRGSEFNNDASIKGKKVIACSRACTDMNVSTDIKDRKTSVSYSKSEESLTTENLADIPNGKFQFKSQLGGQVGNSIRRKSGGNSVNCDRGNPSKSDTSPGVVQSQAMESLEMDIPLNPTEHEDRLPATHKLNLGFDGKPMVEPSVRHPRTRGSEKDCLGNHSTDPPSLDVVRSRARAESHGKKNVGESAHHHRLHGQQTCVKDPSSVLTNFGVQSPRHRQREGDRGAGELANDDAGVRAVDRVEEEDRMEFDGGSETAFTLQ